METALRDALQTVEQQAIRNKERFATVRDHPKEKEQIVEVRA
jgi:hypothetical protein